MALEVRHATVDSPWGPLRLQGTEPGLTGARFLDPERDPQPSPEVPDPIREAAEALDAYFAGTADALDTVPVDLSGGTSFQQDVWHALRAVPAGETRSYAWVAERIGRPDAARAVGQAVGANPTVLVVPCHRIVPSDGGLGGYSAHGGTELKRRILEHEGARPDG